MASLSTAFVPDDVNLAHFSNKGIFSNDALLSRWKTGASEDFSTNERTRGRKIKTYEYVI